MKKMCKITQEAEQRNLCDHEVKLGLVKLLLPDQPLDFPSKFMYRSPGGTAFFVFMKRIWGERNRIKINIHRISL